MIFKVIEQQTFEHYVAANNEDEARTIVETRGSAARYRVDSYVESVVQLPSNDVLVSEDTHGSTTQS